MLCCNQMGDKAKIQGLIEDLTQLVQDAYQEGLSNGARYGYATNFHNSNAKETLDKLDKEVI